MCHTEDNCVCCEQILYQFMPICRVCSQPILNVLCLCSLSVLIQSWRFLSTWCISLLSANPKYTCLHTTGVDCKQILNILVNRVWMCANPKYVVSPLCVCVNWEPTLKIQSFLVTVQWQKYTWVCAAWWWEIQMSTTVGQSRMLRNRRPFKSWVFCRVQWSVQSDAKAKLGTPEWGSSLVTM